MYIIVSVDVWAGEVSSLFELETTDKYTKQKFKPNDDDKGWSSPRWMEWSGGWRIINIVKSGSIN